ncbi:hypothetical protein Tco_0526011 [Tanacetum coccineum]
MQNIKMTMSRMQLNSKFVNNMLPEWGRFLTAIKLNRGLRDGNYDQLYDYLKQHEAHANENKMMLDRFTQHTIDPLALMLNGRQNRGQRNNARGAGVDGYGRALNRVGNANPGQVDKNNAVDEDASYCTELCLYGTIYQSAHPVYDKAGPSYDSDILSEVHDNDHYQDAICEHHEVHEMHDDVQRNYVVDSHADYTSDEVYYTATNSELAVSRLTEMHDAHTVVQARCLELEIELFKLRDKLKYQNLKESFGNNTSLPARDAPDFDSVFVIKKMKASIQGKDNAIKKLRMQISQLNEARSEADLTLDFKVLDFQITQLTDKVTVLQEQNELFRVKNAKIKQPYKELYDSIKITCDKHIDQTTALVTENENLKV